MVTSASVVIGPSSAESGILASATGGVAPRDASAERFVPGAGADGVGGAASFSDNGGTVISIAKIQLIYWGAAWNARPNPSADQITANLQTVVRGSYLTALAQYRQIGRGYIAGARTYGASNPPNPFTDNDVGSFVLARIADGTVPPVGIANQTLYLVVMPQGVSKSGGGAVGEHTYVTDGSGNRVHFGWITNGGDLNGLTAIISHELVESCTDPEGSAVLGRPGTCSQGGWCEIGDVCYADSVIDGVTVQKYWSQRDNGCIAPVWPSEAFPREGIQFRGTLAANATGSWFTFGWPEYYFMLWRAVPTTVKPGAPQLSTRVQIERASGAYLTYWIKVTNLTGAPVDFEGRYTILSR